MFKNILLTSAAALAITVGATSISTPEANAGVSVNLNLGGSGYWGGSHWGGYSGYCGSHKVLIRYWSKKHGHMHKKWVWRSYC